MLAAQSSRGLCAVFLGDSQEELKMNLKAQFPKTSLIEGGFEMNKLRSIIRALVTPPFSLPVNTPIDIQGTDFQRQVWKIVRQIPFGSTTSYTCIAQKIGAPRSIRAVASAVAANSLAIVIPCHRVIRKDGSLCGYRWGVKRKKKLLNLESLWQKAL